MASFAKNGNAFSKYNPQHWLITEVELFMIINIISSGCKNTKVRLN